MAITLIQYPVEAMSVQLLNPNLNTTKPHEVQLLCHLARRCRGNVLEIGTHYGETTRELANAVGPNRLVYSVDFITDKPTMNERQRGEMPTMETVGRAARGCRNVRFLFGDSKALQFDGLDIGFVFIDGDHTLEGVAGDTENALRAYDAGLTRPSMMIVWHDVYDRPDEPWIGVKKYLEGGSIRVAQYIGTYLAVMVCAP